MLTENELDSLGFKKGFCDDGSHYYTYEFSKGLSFITNSSDEAQDGWYVEFFNTEIPVRFTDAESVKTMIGLIQKHTVQ